MTAMALLFVLACATYLLNACFGVAVRTGLVDSSGFRWLHHGLYVATFGLALVAASSLWWSRTQAGWYLLPALVALAALPYVGSARRHPYRHVCAAMVPLPFYILSVIVALAS